MNAFRLGRRLSHADVDFLGELKVSALLGLLEQAAVEECIEAGVSRIVFRLPAAGAEQVLPVLERAAKVASAFDS